MTRYAEGTLSWMDSQGVVNEKKKKKNNDEKLFFSTLEEYF